MECAKKDSKDGVRPPEQQMGDTGQFDDLLRKMLRTPPNPHPKPAKKVAKKKTAK